MVTDLLSMTDTIKDIAGTKYRIERCEDGCFQIPLRAGKGWIYEHGKKTLGVHLGDTNRPLASCKAIMAKVPTASVYVMGDQEAILLCPVSEAKKLLRACGAKTRRQITDEERERW